MNLNFKQDQPVVEWQVLTLPVNRKWSNTYIHYGDKKLTSVEDFEKFEKKFDDKYKGAKLEKHLNAAWYVTDDTRIFLKCFLYETFHKYELEQAFNKSEKPIITNWKQKKTNF